MLFRLPLLPLSSPSLRTSSSTSSSWCSGGGAYGAGAADAAAAEAMVRGYLESEKRGSLLCFVFLLSLSPSRCAKWKEDLEGRLGLFIFFLCFFFEKRSTPTTTTLAFFFLKNLSPSRKNHAALLLAAPADGDRGERVLAPALFWSRERERKKSRRKRRNVLERRRQTKTISIIHRFFSSFCLSRQRPLLACFLCAA